MKEIIVLIVEESMYFENLLHGNYMICTYSDESTKNPDNFETKAYSLNNAACRTVSKGVAIHYLLSKKKEYEDEMSDLYFKRSRFLSDLSYATMSIDSYFVTQITSINNQIDNKIMKISEIKNAINEIERRATSFEELKKKSEA